MSPFLALSRTLSPSRPLHAHDSLLRSLVPAVHLCDPLPHTFGRASFSKSIYRRPSVSLRSKLGGSSSESAIRRSPPRIYVSAAERPRPPLCLSFSLSIPAPLARLLSLAIRSSLSPLFPLSHSRHLAPATASLHGPSPSHLLSPLRYDPNGGAAPLAARKKGGPKRTSYFLCSDSDLGGPKWPPMM